MTFETFIFDRGGGFLLAGIGVSTLLVLYGPWFRLKDVPKVPWVAPIGMSFSHCGATLFVIDSGFFDGSTWRDGVLCHYRDDSGRILELFFTPAQWDQLKGARV